MAAGARKYEIDQAGFQVGLELRQCTKLQVKVVFGVANSLQLLEQAEISTDATLALKWPNDLLIDGAAYIALLGQRICQAKAGCGLRPGII